MAGNGKANALTRLAAAVNAFSARGPSIQFGGVVVEAGLEHFRIAGLGARAAIGDRIVGSNNPRLRGEVIHVDELTALVKAYSVDFAPRVGDGMYCVGPGSLTPCEAWRGRTINALGMAVDGRGALEQGLDARPLEKAARAALERSRADRPLRTGVRAIDVFTPVCFGQRVGIFAGSGVGKSTLLGMLSNAQDFDELVIGLIGERGRELREFSEDILGEHREKAIIVASTGDESAIMRRLAARTAMAVAEWHCDRGRRVLLILDSVTRYAQAAREIAIAAGEPAVARGFPPSVFSDLPRLLERAGPGADGRGSITGIFSVLVDGDDHNDPVADCIRGILDGHIVLDRAIADQGRYPAINILGSVSRLADRVWTPDQRALVTRMRGMIARYEETRDFRAIGGYQRGADAELDTAVALVPRLYDAISQGRDSPRSSDAFRELSDMLSDRETTAQALGQ
jgi:flagellum-specific ATP synthase